MEQFSFEGWKVIVSASIMLHDWLKKTNTTFSYNPKQTKTNYNSLAQVFPCFLSAACNFFEFCSLDCLCPLWLASQWLHWFWFEDCTLHWKSIYRRLDNKCFRHNSESTVASTDIERKWLLSTECIKPTGKKKWNRFKWSAPPFMPNLTPFFS